MACNVGVGETLERIVSVLFVNLGLIDLARETGNGSCVIVGVGEPEQCRMSAGVIELLQGDPAHWVVGVVHYETVSILNSFSSVV